jgi:hypothetical protein
LMTVKQRLSHQLLVDYGQWAQTQTASINIPDGTMQKTV